MFIKKFNHFSCMLSFLTISPFNIVFVVPYYNGFTVSSSTVGNSGLLFCLYLLVGFWFYCDSPEFPS